MTLERGGNDEKNAARDLRNLVGQLTQAGKHVFEHGRRQSPCLRVVTAAVIGIDEHAAIRQTVLCGMRKRKVFVPQTRGGYD